MEGMLTTHVTCECWPPIYILVQNISDPVMTGHVIPEAGYIIVYRQMLEHPAYMRMVHSTAIYKINYTLWSLPCMCSSPTSPLFLVRCPWGKVVTKLSHLVFCLCPTIDHHEYSVRHLHSPKHRHFCSLWSSYWSKAVSTKEHQRQDQKLKWHHWLIWC